MANEYDHDRRELRTDDRALVEAAKDEATCVALWAFQEKQRTSTAFWFWPRRRFLEAVYRRKVKEVDELAEALKADDREAIVAGLPGAD